ncbi:MAG TPA: endonuclease/exonuclease/phosphatase family protein [Panacibacter sp.]|nr:endonuclease/exonuclease/phosphatase family protein [Panacibacter sp.]HNP44835.1 endonuclease/exonuclease/phosphatase family protein [Panacibacter sp.]
MRSILRASWTILCLPLTFAYIISSLSPFIPPRTISSVSVLGLGFPYIFALYFICMILSLRRHRKLAIIMMFLLPFGIYNAIHTFALRPSHDWVTAKDSTTLRVMTWNVQGFANYLRRKKSKAAYRTNKAEMLATIDEMHPDVLCMQEYRNIENAKRRTPIRRELDSLGFKYFYTSKDRAGAYPKNPSVWLEEGVAIYSRYPIIDSGKVCINAAYESDTENLIHADILFNGKPVRIFTAHLESFTIYSDTAGKMTKGENIYEITYEKRRDAQYKIQETEIKHQAEVNVIRQELDKSPNAVIYCGDMNITPSSYTYRYLRGNDLQDAFLEKGSGIGNTFYKIGPTLRIDYILPEKDFEVTQCQRIAEKLSDHYPVVADMKWNH